ncbi:MAG TPA: VCBS repeat-containing protein, partial [Casimicrobiaceae bacterium]
DASTLDGEGVEAAAEAMGRVDAEGGGDQAAVDAPLDATDEAVADVRVVRDVAGDAMTDSAADAADARADGRACIGDLRIAGSYEVPLGLAAPPLDLNGDGKLDLLVAEGLPGGIHVLLGNGDGTFDESVRYANGQGALRKFPLHGRRLSGCSRLMHARWCERRRGRVGRARAVVAREWPVGGRVRADTGVLGGDTTLVGEPPAA